MPEPYENIYIGNFLYTLGYLSCAKGIKLSGITINMLQQTPADKTYGDLLAGLNGKFFLIEFKRNESSVKNEFKKYQQRDLINALNSADNEHIHSLSLKTHYLGFGLGNEKPNILFIPYALIVDEKEQEDRFSTVFNEFCGYILDGGLGVNFDEFRTYISFVRNLFDDPSDGPGGFILIMDEEEFSFYLIRYESVATISEILEQKISNLPQLKEKYAET